MESLKPKIHHNYNINHKAYGRTKANAPCRKHPKHRQSPGVCSLCLNQKLSRLTNTCSSSRSRRATISSLSSSSSSSYISSLSSSDISSYSSPAASYTGSRARKSMMAPFKNLGRETLKKSRSMAFFLQRRKHEDEIGNNIEIKRGFWSKLLPTKHKVLLHSRTTRESTVIAAASCSII